MKEFDYELDYKQLDFTNPSKVLDKAVFTQRRYGTGIPDLAERPSAYHGADSGSLKGSFGRRAFDLARARNDQRNLFRATLAK